MEAVNALIEQFPIVGTILVVLGALVVIGQFIIALTPTRKDDEILESLKKKPFYGLVIDFLASFAPFAKKNKKIGLNKK